MEDTLGVSFFVPTGIFSHVLILVLMEDTLGEVVETVGNEVYTKS